MGAPDKKRILVVEDDPALRKLLASFLKTLDVEVTHAADGRSAMQVLAQEKFDLVCLDVMLPEVSGYDVCEHIRKQPGLQKLPILILSARNLPEDRATAEELGANGYLTKPFVKPDFLRKVQWLLEGKGDAW